LRFLEEIKMIKEEILDIRVNYKLDEREKNK
jgi:hypothetical protein